MTPDANSSWIEVQLIDVRRSEGPDQLARPHAVVLQEHGGSRQLPVYTNPPAAESLACLLAGVETPRPMTYQLAVDLVLATGSRVTEVRITQFVESTFYATVLLEGPAGLVEVDARPSDALNVALTARAPVRVNEDLLNDPAATRRSDWEQFPTNASELVAEFRQRQAGARAYLRGEGRT